MSDRSFKNLANLTVNRASSWSFGLQTLAVILVLTASWIVGFDHSLLR